MKAFFLQEPGNPAGRIACGPVAPTYDEQRHEWLLADGLTRVSAWNASDYELVSDHVDEPPVVHAPMAPMVFYLAFTPQERIAIKTSADAVVREFWETFNLALQTNTPIEPELVSVTGGLAYLRGLGILQSDERVANILAGVPQ